MIPTNNKKQPGSESQPLRETMGKRIRACMDQGLGNPAGRAWSYRTLAAVLHVSPGTLHGWVNGANVPDRKLERLAQLFGRPVTWLRFGEGTPPLDEELLVEVLEAVQAVNERENLRLPAAKIAKLAASFYEMFRDGGPVDRAAVERFTRLASV